MSLLLDALKRAEQEKLARGDRPEPVDASGPAARAAAAALELQPLAVGASSAPRPDPAQARTVFEAKTASRAEKPQGHGVLWVTLGLVIAAVAAAGGYVWYSLDKLTPKVSSAAARPAPPPQAPPPGALVPPPGSGAPGSAATLPPPVEAPRAAEPPKAAPIPKAPEAPAPSPREALLGDLVKEAPAPRPPVLLAPSREVARVHPGVASGYEALRSGDLATARTQYRSAAAAEPANLDAQLGLATLEARGGNPAAASAHYRRALEIDPRNGAALAGLAAMADGLPAGVIESRLREDVARAPDNAGLQFALGNLYASQSRWHEAQAAYFESLRADPGNPDIHHNLAVSLDRLGKGRLAAEQYRRALESARARPAQFDAAAVTRRLGEIAAAER